MKKILLLLSFFTLSFAQDVTYLFEKGNEAYRKENYAQAIEYYHDVIENGLVSGKLYYNLGNAYYKINEIGEAILYYEKAKLLMPENENLQFNLKLTNVKVKDRIQAPPESFLMKVHKKFIHLFSITGWAVIFSLLILTATVLTFLKALLGNHFLHFFSEVALVLALTAILILYPLYSNHSEKVLTQKGVLLVPESEVYAAPDSESTLLFNIHEGALFTLLDSDGNWLKIELIDGKQGWLPKSVCGEV